MSRQPDQPQDDPAHQQRPAGVDPETAARRRARLERRIRNLEHDIERARSAMQADNRWQHRIDEVNAAIEQADVDSKELATPGTPAEALPLPATPVTDIDVQTEMPVTIRFRIGDEVFRYSEEIDWTERGEQRSLPGLRRFEGNPDALIPDNVPADRYETLREHLRHTIGAYAVALREEPRQRELPVTLAELASPCPICGNWRDLRDRCITCQRREWAAQAVRSEIGRLMDERNALLDEIASQREALPVLQRQLRDARTELEKYT